jgi:F-type H+-transporting ATPase subunit delta
MAELATIARPYAEAIFRVASSGDLASWSTLMSEMAQVAAHPDVREFASNPKVSDQQVTDTFLALLKSGVGPEARNFVAMLAENGRLTLLPEIAEQFHALRNTQEGAADAEITSAFEMSDAQVRDLVATLERKFGCRLNPAVTVDSSLIGGVRVTVGDEVLDTSVRAKLQKMHTALAS